MPDFPGPEETKSLAMPGERRRGLDDVQRRAPVTPDPGEEHPQHAVGGSQLRPFPGRAGHRSGAGEPCAPTPAQRVSGTSNPASKGQRTTGSASDNCHLLKRNGVSDRDYQLRGLPDAERAKVTRDLAIQIRQLPSAAVKESLADELANLATEGDFGPDTLQAVATTLAQALVEQPGNPDSYQALARR